MGPGKWGYFYVVEGTFVISAGKADYVGEMEPDLDPHCLPLGPSPWIPIPRTIPARLWAAAGWK